jgi:hypothetical protein
MKRLYFVFKLVILTQESLNFGRFLSVLVFEVSFDYFRISFIQQTSAFTHFSSDFRKADSFVIDKKTDLKA